MSATIASGRARRMMKLGALSGQVGSTYLWQTLLKPFRSADSHQRELLDAHVRNAVRIVESSEELRGAFTKLVQMLSMRDDLFPAQALDVLASAHASAPPMPYRVIREQIRRDLGKPPERIFASFEREAFAAASLGQVHRAELPSGVPVVVKVQYPGIEGTVAQDLENLRALLQILTRIGRDVMRQRIDTASVYRELEERLHEELDYRREAENLALFRRLFADDEEIEVPEVFPELCTRHVLTMGFLDGYPLVDVLAPGVDQELKDWVAIKYFRTVCRQLLHFGVLHVDPQPGNYLVTHHPRLGILDFGSVRVFPEPLRRSYRRLARALLGGDRRQMAAACRALDYLGENDPPEAMIEILETVLEPLLEDRDYEFKRYRSLDKALQVAAVAIEKGLYRTPGHRVFLVRALIGVETYAKQLGTTTNWRRIFAEEVEAAAEKRPARSPAPTPRAPRTAPSATRLRRTT
jgi:predicted unusual protein kinase regulating ubiquinone biosynthesis (AarF/ABC1/UbiB family)